MSAGEELHHLIEKLGDDSATEVSAYLRHYLKGDEQSSANGAGLSSSSGRQCFAQPRTDLATLAARQGVKPLTDFDALLGDFWPEDEQADEFAATIRRWRREGGDA
jgi:hypothetical protein